MALCRRDKSLTQLRRPSRGRGAVVHGARGTLCALLGPNGAGKTTTVRMLLGLIPSSDRSAEVAGIALPPPTQPARCCGAAWGAHRSARLLRPDQRQRQSDLFGGSTASRARPWPAEWSTGFGASSSGRRRKNLRHLVQGDEAAAGADSCGAPRAAGDLSRRADLRARPPPPPAKSATLIATLRAEGRTILLCTHNLSEAGRARRPDRHHAPAHDRLRAAWRAHRRRARLELILRATRSRWRGARPRSRVRSCAARARDSISTLDELGMGHAAGGPEVVRLGGAILAVRPGRDVAGGGLPACGGRGRRDAGGPVALSPEGAFRSSLQQAGLAGLCAAADHGRRPTLILLIALPALIESARAGNDAGARMILETVLTDPSLGESPVEASGQAAAPRPRAVLPVDARHAGQQCRGTRAGSGKGAANPGADSGDAR